MDEIVQSAVGEKVIVLHPVIIDFGADSKILKRTPQEALDEALGLAAAINLDVVHSETVNVKTVRPATLVGSGIVERMKELAEEKGAKVLYVDHALSPIQQRNLERDCNLKVIDRTGLILEIFGDRAKTKEGTLQVELAALEYQRSRLVKAWSHLERQRGGGGTVGGPGETQKELDRRMIDERIKKIKIDLEGVRRNRSLQRESRRKEPFPIVALVGYTNAGKSTLFNRITGENVFAKDLLFATLDTTMRGHKMPSGKRAIFSDTVGFISDLPHGLVAAFRATLEEVQDADVILHVRDISQSNTEVEKQDVIKILDELGIDAENDERIIDVLNKVDALPEEERLRITNKSDRTEKAVAVSALTGEGIDELTKTIDKILCQRQQTVNLSIKVSDGAALSWLYSHGNVLERFDDEEFINLTVGMEEETIERFLSAYNYELDREE